MGTVSIGIIIYIYNIYIYGDTTDHSVNVVYNSYYTKKTVHTTQLKFNETWLIHVLTKRTQEVEIAEKQIDSTRLDRQKACREKRKFSKTEDQRVERLAQKRTCQRQRLSGF